MTEVQLKAQSKLRVIELSKKELELKQSIEQMELTVRQTQAMIKEKQQDLKAIQADMDKERSSGMAVWETVGITTQSYRDPFHTGLSKRTPNGAHWLLLDDELYHTHAPLLLLRTRGLTKYSSVHRWVLHLMIASHRLLFRAWCGDRAVHPHLLVSVGCVCAA